MLVSFVIPAYNASGTIIRCLDSIYALSLEPNDFEVVLIDDCSKDNTVAIVEDYAQHHNNITVLGQQENHRQGAARNKGVNVAQGEYICFVDSDDAVAEGVIDALHLGVDMQLDMVVMHFVSCDKNGKISSEQKRLSWQQGEIFSGIEFQMKHPYWCSGPVGYLYNSKFLKATYIPFEEDVLYEDSDFVMKHLYYAQRMAYSQKSAYYVYYNTTSTTHSLSHKKLSDYLFLGTRMLVFHQQILKDISNGNINATLDEVKRFSENVLEGGCWNVSKSFRRLYKLESRKEVVSFYNRVDCKINRQELLTNKCLRSYFWNLWTKLCLSHRKITIAITSVVIKVYSLYKNVKHK